MEILPSLPANGVAVSISPPPNNGGPPPQRPQLRCPRCDSTETKFCYFNNYSLSQPRHFCKSCRRYWTHGGALRNVPVGGGSRKSKKHRSSSRTALAGDVNAACFPLPTLSLLNPNPNHLSHFGHLNLTPLAGSNVLGLNFNYRTGGAAAASSFFASSIESSLSSCLNPELHWRLQQQRMTTTTTTVAQMEEKPQPIFFRNLEITNTTPEVGMHQWFFDSSYGSAAISGGGDDDGNASRLNPGGYVLDKGLTNYTRMNECETLD